MSAQGPWDAEQRVLVLAATLKDASLARDVLDRAGVAWFTCLDLQCLCNEIEKGAAAVLIPEEAITPQSGNRLASLLARQPTWSDLPILVLARAGADSAVVAQAMDLLGNVTVLERPMRISALVSAVRSALRARRHQYQIASTWSSASAPRRRCALPIGARTNSSRYSRTSSAIRSRRFATRCTCCSSRDATTLRRATSAR